MYFSYYSWKDCTDTGRSTGSYLIFYQFGPIEHDTRVTGPVDRPSADSDYNATCNAVMALAYFGMLIHELLNKDTYIFP